MREGSSGRTKERRVEAGWQGGEGSSRERRSREKEIMEEASGLIQDRVTPTD